MDSLGRSRFEPKDPDGVIAGTERQLDFLQFIHRLPYATSRHIDRYFNLAYYAAEVRAELHAKDYIENHINAFGRDSWTTTRKGTQLLRYRRPDTIPLYPKGSFNKHQRFCMLIGYGLILGAKENDIAFDFSEAIINHPDCPPIDVKNPYAYVIGPGDKYFADARIFKLAHGRRHMFFWGWEADMKTESLDSEAENSIANKLRKQELFLENDIHFKRFGMRNINFPYITLDALHRDRLRDLVHRKVKKEHWPHFLFAAYPRPIPRLGFPDPSGELLTGDWYSVDGPVSIVSLLKGANDGRREKARAAVGA